MTDPAPRSIELEVEVSGTPEQVWDAIATGPGISSWYVPSTVAEEAGGPVTSRFGPGDDRRPGHSHRAAGCKSGPPDGRSPEYQHGDQPRPLVRGERDHSPVATRSGNRPVGAACAPTGQAGRSS